MSSLPWDRPRRVRSWFSERVGARGLKLAALALLAGIVVSGVAGYALHRHFMEKAASFNLDELGQMESASTIFDRRKQVFGHIYLQNREPIPLSQMPADLQNAVISAEDARFYTHSGSDVRGIVRAALKNFRATRVKQGASTITQQLARNSLALGGKTFSRKILEIYVSRRIETTLTKEQILEYYLNRIYLGSGLYGVEAAAKGYFGKPAHDLSLGEAATLAGMIKSPTYLSPWNNKARATEQRDFVLGRMVEEGKISRAQADAAVAEPLAVQPRRFASSDSYAVEAIR
ncbi:MAG: transglycosylase domain-containing protein, partial [Verrucomicrobia bacterium]|nr:transglycosylase domain-containing protein [Verrucomicrobiota bacterium]